MIDIPKSARQRMAESVTRHAQISSSDDFKRLTYGIDTLDIGLYVEWKSGWRELKLKFDVLKKQAEGTNGLPISQSVIRSYLFLPGGKAPNYRYHLQYPEYHAFISLSQVQRRSPNIYISINSEALWEHGPHELYKTIVSDIEGLGALVAEHKVSRVDICVDYWLKESLSLGLMQSQRVCRSNDSSQYMQGEELETFYMGGRQSVLKLRIYDKGKETKNKETEERWLQIWQLDSSENVWRVEFQIRRTFLKQFEINSLDDLKKKIPALWSYCTEEWFSLRLPDNENQTRRTVNPWWGDVQRCASLFGYKYFGERQCPSDRKAQAKWYLDRIANLIVGYASCMKISDFQLCTLRLVKELIRIFKYRNFNKEFIEKSIKLGIPVKSEAPNEYPG